MSRLIPLVLVVLIAGCGRRGSWSRGVQSQGLGERPVLLEVGYTMAVYAHDDRGDTAFFLTDIPLEQILDGTAQDGQIVHVELLWAPKAGRTPMDDSATNATVRHVIISEGEVGLYGGAGFVLVGKKLGRAVCPLDIEDTSMRLLESTDGFRDPLTPARITGSFKAERDAETMQRLRRAASQLVTNAMGRRTFVQDSPITEHPSHPSPSVIADRRRGS